MQDWVYRLDHDAVVVAESRLPVPLVTYLGDGRWRLERAYDYRDGETTITVPEGFEFDLSPVPRAFWSFIAPFELSIAAPLLHDFLYRYGGKPPCPPTRASNGVCGIRGKFRATPRVVPSQRSWCSRGGT